MGRTGPDRRAILTGALAGAIAAPAAAASRKPPAISRNLPDVVVVGAGAFGGWTALELVERGARTTLVDLYGPGNPRAASGDESRLIRASYGDREIYTRWASEAFDLWHQRQEEFGRRVIYANGSLRVVSPAALAAQQPIFERLGLPLEILTPEEAHARWPQVRYDDAETVIFEPKSGAVKARESMIAVAETFQAKGGTVRVGHARPGAAAGGKLSQILVDDEPLSAGLFIFACGPWLPKVFPELLGDRIRVPRREIFYIGSPPHDRRYRWEHFPNLADPLAYTAADIDYGTKIAARLPDTAMDPDDGERMPTPFLAEQVKDYVARRLPGLVGQPVVAARVCQTEYSDNNHYIIDKHPQWSNAWITGAGSGHAFKMGPVLGRNIADWALGAERPPELAALFSLSAHGPAVGGQTRD
ncbi:NAD(P)/FAD-dependent oxidoreductase [Phenylobacterium sp.]|uniref:NAD(P)/FAD-dependent oxidoreductase n=1 Tax=Phenylobacterium sp. TaxID=1871053 RepID=UPI0035B180FD